MVQSQQTVLFVLTSTKTMGAGGKPTGAWLEEVTGPYYAIRDAGFMADIATTAGGLLVLALGENPFEVYWFLISGSAILKKT